MNEKKEEKPRGSTEFNDKQHEAAKVKGADAQREYLRSVGHRQIGVTVLGATVPELGQALNYVPATCVAVIGDGCVEHWSGLKSAF